MYCCIEYCVAVHLHVVCRNCFAARVWLSHFFHFHFLYGGHLADVVFGQVSSHRYWQTVGMVLVNLLIVSPVFFASIYPLTKWRNMSYGSDLPPWPVVARDVVVGVLLLEVTFYYGHRYEFLSIVHKHMHGSEHCLLFASMAHLIKSSCKKPWTKCNANMKL